MRLWDRVVEANRPGDAEHSVRFRTSSTAAVVVALAACWSQGELSPVVAAFAVVATIVGNVLSYRRRERPWPFVKPILALGVVGGFVWFAVTVTRTATPGGITTVERPLAVLFAWVLATHAFDVPARRDVAYSLGGSAALMAVAAAQTVDLSLGGYVIAWMLVSLWGLVSMWQSMSGSRGVPWATLAVASVVVAVLAVVFVGVLPAPNVSASLIFPSSSSGSPPVNSPSNLTDGASGLPAKAAKASGRSGVGGFLGFAKSLDIGLRASLGTQVVMRVRATQPSYWVGQTYDTWNGQSWTQAGSPTAGSRVVELRSGSPFTIPPAADQVLGPVGSRIDIQTFYLAQSGPNLVFHADNAVRVYLQSQHLFLTGNGTIVSGASMGAGTIYTVVSNDNAATPAQLQSPSPTVTAPGGATSTLVLPASQLARYRQLPRPYRRADALARSITAGIAAPSGSSGRSAPSGPQTYSDVQAIESWMSRHIKYSTAIPALAPGQDAVNAFLFGTRVGYCEQISTAMTVMLRGLGIPAREAVGYVPGPYNPITDLYDVQAKDAHAWVQVWFPGFGWQSFDPTATVPLVNPSPGSVLAHDIAGGIRRLPWVPIGAVSVVLAAALAVRRRLARRPPTWAHRVAADLERGGARAGIPRRPTETLVAYADRISAVAPEHRDAVVTVASMVERFAYGAVEPSADEITSAIAAARRFRSSRPRGRWLRQQRPGAGAGAAVQERVSANASSNDAPAASRGR